MTRKRDHKAIYAARKAKAEAKGITLTEATGHSARLKPNDSEPTNDHDGHTIDITDDEWVAFADGAGFESGLVKAEPIFGTTVLAIPDDVTIEAWAELGVQLRTALNSTPWWVGDWLLYAHHHYETDADGNAVSTGVAAVRRHLADLGFEHDTVVRCLRVADRFRPSTRHENLSWAHHLEVAALDAGDAHRLLNEASVEGWSTRDLREHVRRLQAIDVTGQESLPGLGKACRLTVRFGAGAIFDPAVLEEAATRIGQVLDELGLDGEVKVA